MIATKMYEDEMTRLVSAVKPHMIRQDIRRAIQYSINKRSKSVPCTVNNNYTGASLNSTLDEMTEWIMEREPICTAYGVMFKRHGSKPHPLIKLIQEIVEQRDVDKGMMFKYLEAHDYEKVAIYNMKQLLDKRDANSIYGCLGNAACVLYNLYVAASITAQGRSTISTATLFFESFLANNVKFGSLEEVLHFIDTVCMEAPTWKYDDNQILDRNIPLDECFAKIMKTCGDWRKGRFRWVPSIDDARIIYKVLKSCDQRNLNRLYYKNNLYAFLDNTVIMNGIKYILKSLNKPYLSPNKVPEEIQVELDAFQDFFREYVFYNYMYIDRIDRCQNMIKDVCVLSDTDSTIVSFDAFYHFVLDRLMGETDIPICSMEVDMQAEINKMIKMVPEKQLKYDFYNDDIIEKESMIKPFKIIPQNNLRYSIVNIIAYISGNLCNEYMVKYTKCNHSYREGDKCLLYLKNEFLFSRTLMTGGKKNYASNMELKEGVILEQGIDTSLDIKGLPIKKSTTNDTVKKELQSILYEDVLKAQRIDPLRIIERIAILEKQIERSLRNGEKTFYKPVVIKAAAKYDDPMRIQGIKGSVIWNYVKDDELSAIDLTARNTVDIAKVNITAGNIDKIRESHPAIFEKFVRLFNDATVFNGKTVKSIDSIAIPVDVDVPSWLIEFIDYNTIINDNTTNFPFESCGIPRMGSDSVSYSTIMKI